MAAGQERGRARSASEWVSLLRAQLELTDWPTERDAWRLAALLEREGRIALEVSTIPKAYHLPGTRPLIVVPESYDGPAATSRLLHEIGHALMRDLSPVYLPAVARPLNGLRLIRSAHHRSEALACQFVLAWRMPWELAIETDSVEQLAQASGCSLEDAAARWAQMLR